MASEGANVRALFELKLLDQSGKERDKVQSGKERPYTFSNRGKMW